MDLTKIDNIWVEDIDYNDAPDFVDAHIGMADYNGIPMTDAQLDEINENYDFVYDSLMTQLY